MEHKKKNGVIGIIVPNEKLIEVTDLLRNAGINPVVSKQQAPVLGFLILEVHVTESTYDEISAKLEKLMNPKQETQEFIGVMTYYARVDHLRALFSSNNIKVHGITPHEGDLCYVDIKVADHPQLTEKELCDRIGMIMSMDSQQSHN